MIGATRALSIRRATVATTVLCLLLMGRGATAQTTLPSVAVPPTSVLVPNYNGVPIGEIGGLEAGAFLARASDSSSVFYNPAGLTRAEKTSVSGTAGVFQFDGVSAAGLDESAHTFQQVPAMFAFVLKDVLGRKDLAAGLSVARTSAWNHSIDFEHTVPLGTTTDRLSYSSEAHLDQWLASMGVGYAGQGKWRAGTSLDLQFTSIDRRQSIANQYRTATSLAALSVTSRSEMGATHMRLTVGGQYEVTPSVTAGAVLRTRGWGLHTSGMAMLEGVSAAVTGITTASFFDDTPDVDLRVPFEFKTGVAYVRPRTQVEFDLLVYDGAGTYDAVISDRTIGVLDSSGGIIPSTAVYPASPLVIDSRAVTNIAIGGQYHLNSTGSWIVHGGYGTDRSPVGPSDTTFTKAHLQKFSAGISMRATHFLGSAGLHFVTGTSEPVTLRELPIGQLTTKFHVGSVGFVYSLSVLF